MRRPNHASRFEGTAKTNLQPSRASDTETLQSQVNKAAKKRLSLSGLEILHGRLEKRTLIKSLSPIASLSKGALFFCRGSHAITSTEPLPRWYRQRTSHPAGVLGAPLTFPGAATSRGATARDLHNPVSQGAW